MKKQIKKTAVKKKTVRKSTTTKFEFDLKIKSGWKPERQRITPVLPFEKLKVGQHFDVTRQMSGYSKTRALVKEYLKKNPNVFISAHEIKDANKKLVCMRVFRQK